MENRALRNSYLVLVWHMYDIDAEPEEFPTEKIQPIIERHVEQIKQAISEKLTEKERRILSLYYGLNGTPHSLREVGFHFSLSKERIRQCNNRSFWKISQSPFLQKLACDLKDLVSGNSRIDRIIDQEKASKCIVEFQQFVNRHATVDGAGLLVCVEGCMTSHPCGSCAALKIVDPLSIEAVWPLITPRTGNCLKNDDIYHIGTLRKKTAREMLRVPNFGEKSLTEIKDCMAEYGVSFANQYQQQQ